MRCLSSPNRIYSIGDALLQTFFTSPTVPRIPSLPHHLQRSFTLTTIHAKTQSTYASYRPTIDSLRSSSSSYPDPYQDNPNANSPSQDDTSSSSTENPSPIDPTTSRRYRNEFIPSRHIHLVSPTTNTLSPPISLSTELRSLNPQTHYLEAVSINPPTGYPIVKLIDKKLERERESAAKKRKRDIKQVTKYIEMNWAIAPSDLAHRLKRAREFLQAGARVEVLLARKRRGQRYAGVEEAEVTLRRVREGLSGNGNKEVREWSQMRGQVGGEAHLFFEAVKKDNKEGR